MQSCFMETTLLAQRTKTLFWLLSLALPHCFTFRLVESIQYSLETRHNYLFSKLQKTFYCRFLCSLNHSHLRAKRRGKGGKYKKNGEQENKLEQSEVKKKEIFRDCERITISCQIAYFPGWVSSEAHSLQPWGGGWLVQCLPWGQPRGHPGQGNNTHMVA